MYKIIIAPKARKQSKVLAKIYKRSVKEAIADLKEDPSIGKALGRELTDLLSYRIGVYRIIYKIDEQSKVVTIFSIGHRSKVYL